MLRSRWHRLGYACVDADQRMLTLRHLVNEEGGLFMARPEERKVLGRLSARSPLFQVGEQARHTPDLHTML